MSLIKRVLDVVFGALSLLGWQLVEVWTDPSQSAQFPWHQHPGPRPLPARQTHETPRKRISQELSVPVGPFARFDFDRFSSDEASLQR
jgi:hypothetical protein